MQRRLRRCRAQGRDGLAAAGMRRPARRRSQVAILPPGRLALAYAGILPLAEWTLYRATPAPTLPASFRCCVARRKVARGPVCSARCAPAGCSGWRRAAGCTHRRVDAQQCRHPATRLRRLKPQTPSPCPPPGAVRRAACGAAARHRGPAGAQHQQLHVSEGCMMILHDWHMVAHDWHAWHPWLLRFGSAGPCPSPAVPHHATLPRHRHRHHHPPLSQGRRGPLAQLIHTAGGWRGGRPRRRAAPRAVNDGWQARGERIPL